MQALLPGMEPGFEHVPEFFRCFSVTLLADNTLSPPVFKSYRDTKAWDPEYYTLEPHVFCQTGAREVHMSNQMFIWNLSKPNLALGQLPQMPIMWSWAGQYQDITVLGLGAQDLVRGIWGVEEVMREPDFWLNQLKRVTEEMVDYRHRFATRLGRLDEFNKWCRSHTFFVYPLPEIPPAEIEKYGRISTEDYFAVKREQHRNFDRAGVQAELKRNNIHLLGPDIHNPRFEDGRLADEFADEYVAPIFEKIRFWFCARCREPRLHNGSWQKAGTFLLPGQDPPKRAKKKKLARKGKVPESHILNRVEYDVWLEILSYLTLFDIGSLRRTCKAFYRLCHDPIVRKCEGVLDIEAESIKLRVPR